MLDRVTGTLAAMAVCIAGAVVYLAVGGGAADPLALHLETVGAAITPAGEAVPLRVVAPGGTFSEGLYAIGDDRLRIRVAETGVEGAQMAEQERARILGLFEERQAPYPGALSNALRCPEALRPAELPDRAGAVFLLSLFANDRMAFGACAEDLLRYRATVGAFVDRAGSRLVRVEYFEPKEAEPRGPDTVRSFRWSSP